MRIHLHKPTDLHFIFFDNAATIDADCVLESDITKADLIVVDDPLRTQDIYRENVVFAVLHEEVPERYPANVVFVNKRGITPALLSIMRRHLSHLNC